MIVYEQVGQCSMRFNFEAHKDSSPLVKMQEDMMAQYLGQDSSMSNMGASIETQHLQAAITAKLLDDDQVQIQQSKVVSIKPATTPDERPAVELEDGTIIESSIVVGSDGEKSKTRSEYGIGASGLSYN